MIKNKKITEEQLNDLEALIKKIDPDKKLFVLSNEIIKEKKKIIKERKNANFK